MPLLLLCLLPCADDPMKPLDAFIARQVEAHRLPALSVAVVDRGRVLWERHYAKATPDTVYRVGSVSKLFTDLAVMKLVEEGKIDLDGPLPKYVPGWKMADDRGDKITLRQLMSHRAGLVREPPKGNYFDDKCDSLDETVESMKSTRLVYEPGTRTKYSNAGIGVVGHAVEKVVGRRFAPALREMLLDPLGMKASSFEPTAATRKHLAPAVMWTYHGREFPAPTFELGASPAGCMYSTAADQARFLRMLLNKGELDGKRVVAGKTLDAMWTPQFTDDKEGFGLGFLVGKLDGRRAVRHGGAIYGFSTDLVALPDDGLGVIAASARDCSNAVVSRIADAALRFVIAAREKKAPPALDESAPLTADEARSLAGRYEAKPGGFEWVERGGELWHLAGRGGFVSPVRARGKGLVIDGTLAFGPALAREDGGVRLGGTAYQRSDGKKPAECPAAWRGLVGEYGPDHLPTVILERDGRLVAMVEWFFVYPLTRESDTVFRFDDRFGMYHGEKVTFEVGEDGRATRVVMAGLPFDRRKIPGEPGVFKIKPLRPVSDLSKDAKKATPPAEADVKFRESELVELTALDGTIQLDVKYATAENFLGSAVYPSPKASLQRPAAEALVRVNKKLAGQGYGVRVFDGFRPWWVTHVFWHATPAAMRQFVADPSKGSRHNRGCAVDLTLYDRKTGQAVEMPGGYDEFSDRSYPGYEGGTSRQRWHRELLRRAMEEEGFTVYEAEWWHFDYKDWRKYPIGNAT
ncbi:MAG: serine hydrolase [Gemmataceae bacterium]